MPYVNAALADATACKNLADSLIKSSVTPYHSASLITFVLTNAGGGPDSQKTASQTSETIFTGSEIYVRIGSGKWRQVQAPLDELKKLVQKNAESFTDCERLNDESRNGVATEVYTGHAVTPNIIIAMQVAVAKGRGLPVETITDIIQRSAKDQQSRHVTIKYDYEKIAPPIEKP